MDKRNKSLIYAAIIGLIIVAIFLGFLTSLTNPISWILIGVLVLVPILYKKTKSDSLISWKEEYSVGIADLDDDHKKLISLLNQFNTAYDYAMSENYEKQCLEELVSYTKYHFEKEEKLLSENGYEDFEAHKAEHEKMIAQVVKFVELYNEQGHDALDEVVTFLSDWLVNHINGTDKAYSKHLNEKGVF